jgi:hypothetical protein
MLEQGEGMRAGSSYKDGRSFMHISQITTILAIATNDQFQKNPELTFA